MEVRFESACIKWNLGREFFFWRVFGSYYIYGTRLLVGWLALWIMISLGHDGMQGKQSHVHTLIYRQLHHELLSSNSVAPFHLSLSYHSIQHSVFGRQRSWSLAFLAYSVSPVFVSDLELGLIDALVGTFLSFSLRDKHR